MHNPLKLPNINQFLLVDVWNGDNSIIVTHGRTQCTQIDLKDVLHAINAYAFEYSEYLLGKSLNLKL